MKLHQGIKASSLLAILSCALNACSGSGASPIQGPDGSGAAGNGDGSGGTAAGGAGSSVEPPKDDDFQLLFRDDFDSLDETHWQLMTHSWPGNVALFSEDSVKVEDGHMTLTLLPAPSGTEQDGEVKQFLGAEVRSVETIRYGRVRARARWAKGSAVVSSLVTIYTPWPADNWNELDIECLGQDPTQLQYNAMVYTGPPTTPPVTTSVKPTDDPEIKDLGFDSSEDFHEYTIEWTPKAAFFSVDGKVTRVWDKNIELMDQPQNVLLTLWASGAPTWAGAVDDSTEGAQVVYDWVEVSSYTP